MGWRKCWEHLDCPQGLILLLISIYQCGILLLLNRSGNSRIECVCNTLLKITQGNLVLQLIQLFGTMHSSSSVKQLQALWKWPCERMTLFMVLLKFGTGWHYGCQIWIYGSRNFYLCNLECWWCFFPSVQLPSVCVYVIWGYWNQKGEINLRNWLD